MNERQPKVGTWDGMQDAIDALNKSGLVFVLHVGMENSRTLRTRTNCAHKASLDWMAGQAEKNMESLREGFE